MTESAPNAPAGSSPVSPDTPGSDESLEDVEATVAKALGGVRRVSLDDPETADRAGNGMAELVLTLVKLLHELLEKQAIRRMDAGTLTDEEIERIGRTLMHQADEIERLCDVFDIHPSDLDIPLGSVTHLDA